MENGSNRDSNINNMVAQSCEYVILTEQRNDIDIDVIGCGHKRWTRKIITFKCK